MYFRILIRSLAFTLLALAFAGCSWLARYERALPATPLLDMSVYPATASAAQPPTPMPFRTGFIADTGPLTPEQERQTFTVPPGFEVQLVASEPDIPKPMQLAFDERGRLLASCSTDYPLGPSAGEAPRDRVMLLDIDGETGAATRIQTFAEGFNICSGVEALPGGRVLLAHAPDILLLTDDNDDGVADRRETILTGFARDDTHELPNSFTWGIDGWLYGLQGHVNVSNVKDRAGAVTAIHHGNVYRFQPDGSRIEVWARGMSNPWGLTFDLEQNLFASDCESRPFWQIVQGLPYQGFLQAPEPLGFAPYITEDSHGASGFAGLVSYSAEMFPSEYHNGLFLGNPITARIHHDRPRPVGSMRPLQREPDFLTSTDPWFRPVDMELGPDGALYVADWYNKIIAHVEVPLDHPARDKSRGRIWRIVYRGDKKPAGPMDRDWSVTPLDALVDALVERNAWVRRMAANQIVYRFPGAAIRPCRAILRTLEVPPVQRLEVLWLLHRLGAMQAREIAAVLADPNPDLRAAAVRMLDAALPVSLLDDPSPRVVREAALSLRRAPTPESFRTLLARAPRIPKEDTLLQYCFKVALRDHLADQAVLASLREATLAGQDSDLALELLAKTPTLEAAALLGDQLAAGTLPAAQLRAALENILAKGDAGLIQRAVFDATPDDLALRAYAAGLLQQAKHVHELGLDPGPLLKSWCARLSGASDPRDRLLALQIASEYGLPEGAPMARETLADPRAELAHRELAARLLLALDRTSYSGLLLSLAAKAAEPAPVRRMAAREVARGIENGAEFQELLDALKGAPGASYSGAVEGLRASRRGIELLLDAVEAGALSPAHINDHVTRIHVENQHDAALLARYKELTQSAFKAEEEGETVLLAAALRERFTAAPARDIANGQRVFEENCMVCHRIGGVGALIGPNLDGVGNRGIERLLQDITMPNQDIDPAFRTTILELEDLETVDGLVVREDASSVVLVNTLGIERVIAKDMIAGRRTVILSPMPTNLASIIPENDFLDVLGFLLHPPARIVPITEQARARMR